MALSGVLMFKYWTSCTYLCYSEQKIFNQLILTTRSFIIEEKMKYEHLKQI